MLTLMRAYESFRGSERFLLETINRVSGDGVKDLRNYVFSLYNTDKFLDERNVASMSTRKDLLFDENKLYVVLDCVLQVPKPVGSLPTGWRHPQFSNNQMEIRVELTAQLYSDYVLWSKRKLESQSGSTL